MTDNDVKEMLQILGYGDTPPDALMRLIVQFRRRKSAFHPASLDEGDVVTCTIIYDCMTSGRKKRETDNG